MATHKRAPRGYRIVQWADGFYHVYHGGTCIHEVLNRKEALRLAYNHSARMKKVTHGYWMSARMMRDYNRPEIKYPAWPERLLKLGDLPPVDTPND